MGNELDRLPWSRFFELHVVKKVSAILHRRWRLGLGYVDVRSSKVQPPRFVEEHSRGMCGVIQEVEPGMRACAESAATALSKLRTIMDAGKPQAQIFSLPCHAGIRELVVPIVPRDTCIGGLLCGGFIGKDSPEGEATVLHMLHDLAVFPGDSRGHTRNVPRLSSQELSFVAELVTAAAEEIAIYCADRAVSLGRTSSARAAPDIRSSYGAIIGRALPMQELYTLLDRVVRSDTTVLIQGENGTGKELVARAIHDGSARSNRRFVVTNCSAFNDNLLDSELFGHKRGAFTGAITDKLGLFEVADQGTFFLDEIGDMSPALQVKVLRVLQEGTFIPVGDTETRKVDVRIIAATNRDLKAMVAAGEFREDLYYRINVINLHIPPLRDRREDIPLLIDYFLSRQGKEGGANARKTLSGPCMQRLLQYRWPGNVRELENEIERLVVLSGDESEIPESLLSQRILQHDSETAEPEDKGASQSLPEALERLERRMILEALKRHNWNKTRASAELDISRRNLIRLVQKYDLESTRQKLPI